MTLLLTYQPNSLPPGRYVVTMDGTRVATAVHYSAAPPFVQMSWLRAVPDWEKNLILLDGPLELAAHVVGKHFTQTFKRPVKHPTIQDLLNQERK